MLWLGILLFSVSVTADFMTPNYRLPENLKPTHYRLDLVTDLDNFKFTGEVWIKVKCLKATKVIVLHSVGLVVSLEGIRVERMGADSKPVRVTGGSSFDVFTIDVDPSLEAGQTYSIYIPYSGKLGQNLNGYYRSRYLHRPSNTTRWLGVTKFEPFYAREAFPCFDEPAMKAKFSIRLAHKDTYTAISNMPVAKTIPMKNRKGWSWDEFEESVPMSTYLVAWMISDFGYKAPPHQNGVQFRIWARKDALNQVNFAADIGPKVLKNYEKLFDIKYPLPKQDMAAIPDFGAGAMENWGLITYRETKLLYDPSRPSVKDRERIAYVIAHELAHQWFGNLVTMKWWSDLWLNEGFATFVGTLGADAVLKGFNYLKEASIAYIAAVYELDSLKSSHPISVKVGGGWEIEEIFDAISYKKGSTVLRMMYNFLGADTFNKGVSNYLKAHKYSNAEQDDLWAALTNQAHEDKVLPGKMTVKQIMDSWTLQTGYPVLKVERDYKDGTAYVSQERFLHVKSEDHKDKPICWWFPLTYTTQPEANFKDLSPKQWLHCEEKKEKIKNLVVGPDKWLIVNIQLTGLARVMYDSKNWQLIINTLNSDNFKTIDELNRAGLIMDSFDFAQRGDLPYDTALKLSAYLSRETAALPLTRGMIALSFLDHMMSRTSNYGTFKQHMKRILTPLYSRYNKLAAMPKDIEKSRIHILLSRKFCKYKIGDCVEQAGHLYENWRHNGDSDNAMVIPPDLTGLVLCTAVRQGGEKVWNEMYKKFQNAKDANEKSSILGALRCSNEVRILKRLLEYSIDPKSAIRKQDSANVFAGVASRDHGFSVAFDFFQQRFDDIYAYIPRKNKIGKYLTSLASKIMSQHELDKLKNLVDEHPQEFEASKFQTKQALEKATLNIKWHKENYEKVSKLLA